MRAANEYILRPQNEHYCFISFCLTHVNPHLVKPSSIWSVFQDLSITIFVFHVGFEVWFWAKKGWANELVILCSRSASASDLLSLNSDNAVGRLYKSFQFWRGTLQAEDFVMNIISVGYKLSLLRYPPRCFIKNRKSALGPLTLLRLGSVRTI